MAQYNNITKEFKNGNSALFEVLMLANEDGLISSTNPLNISGDSSGGYNPGPIDSIEDVLSLYKSSDIDGDYRFYRGENSDFNDMFTFIQGGGKITTDNLYMGPLIENGIGASDRITIQTKKNHSTAIGTTNIGFIGFSFSSETNGVVQRVGMFDDSEGFYLEMRGSNPILCIKSHNDVLEYPVSEWTGNKLDGSDPENPVIISWSDNITFCFRYEWSLLGGIEFYIIHKSNFYKIHEVVLSSAVLTSDATAQNLPVRWHIENTKSRMVIPKMSLDGALIFGLSRDKYDTRSTSIHELDKLVHNSTNGTGIFALKIKDIPQVFENNYGVVLSGVDMKVDHPMKYQIVVVDDSTNFTDLQWESVSSSTVVECSTTQFNLSDTITSVDGAIVIAGGYILPGETLSDLLIDNISKRSRTIYFNPFTRTSQIIAVIGYAIDAGVNVYSSVKWNEVL